MKSLLLAALLALAPPQETKNTADIEGRVLRAGSQEPIPNVQITLIKSNVVGTALSAEAAAALDSLQLLVSTAPPGVSQATLDSIISSREQSLGLAPGTFSLTSPSPVLTDAAGHFSFKNQAPGKYTLRAVLDGYFGPPLAGSASTNVTKTVTVEVQKPVPPTDIFMVKAGIIAGRVRDPNGQPATGITVAAMRMTYSNGRPQWTAAVSKPTDDRGEYRIFWVSPGEYYVGVTPRVATAIPGPQDSWARTFYPGVVDPTTAGALLLKDGAELTGIDFSIQTTASASTFKITGRATNPLAVPYPATGVVDRNANSFILSPREPGVPDASNIIPSVQNSLPAAARPNGEFEIRNVRPGSYDLFAYYLTPNTPVPPATAPAQPGTPQSPPVPPPFRRYYIDRARVDIRNSDVEGITLQIQKGTEIRGKVVSQGTTSVPMDKIRLSLRSTDTLPDVFASIVAISVDASGDFSAPDIASASYSLQVNGLPETAYVADIRQGGTTIFNSGLTVGNQPGVPLEIVVNANGGIIDGYVQAPDHKPAANAMVVMVPPVDDRQNAMRYRTTGTDQEGKFSMKGVPPGEYTLFAWESVPVTAWMNSDFLAKYQNRGRAVLVTQGTRHETQLELIPDDISRR
jgi:protocatechuate 3,4-dioxygenase beta subunit